MALALADILPNFVAASDCGPLGMYGPPLHCKQKKGMTVWFAHMYPAFV
jgi:hypothetical protein